MCNYLFAKNGLCNKCSLNHRLFTWSKRCFWLRFTKYCITPISYDSRESLCGNVKKVKSSVNWYSQTSHQHGYFAISIIIFFGFYSINLKQLYFKTCLNAYKLMQIIQMMVKCSVRIIILVLKTSPDGDSATLWCWRLHMMVCGKE